MKKILITTFVLIILALVSYFVLNFFCKVLNDCTNCYDFSYSKDKSIEKGYYLFSYHPIKDKVKLKYHNDSIFFKEAWVENIWIDEDKRCLFTNLKKTNEFNITLEFEEIKSDTNRTNFIFMLDAVNCPKSSGTMNDWKKEIRTFKLPDTLWIIITEKNPIDSIGWQESLDGYTVGFTRQIEFVDTTQWKL